tara:strand:+ start:6578 stop:8185 length:1608 start_codon:yes stop_codon:yes gene_type:complete
MLFCVSMALLFVSMVWSLPDVMHLGRVGYIKYVLSSPSSLCLRMLSNRQLLTLIEKKVGKKLNRYIERASSFQMLRLFLKAPTFNRDKLASALNSPGLKRNSFFASFDSPDEFIDDVLFYLSYKSQTSLGQLKGNSTLEHRFNMLFSLAGRGCESLMGQLKRNIPLWAKLVVGFPSSWFSEEYNFNLSRLKEGVLKNIINCDSKILESTKELNVDTLASIFKEKEAENKKELDLFTTDEAVSHTKNRGETRILVDKLEKYMGQNRLSIDKNDVATEMANLVNQLNNMSDDKLNRDHGISREDVQWIVCNMRHILKGYLLERVVELPEPQKQNHHYRTFGGPDGNDIRKYLFYVWKLTEQKNALGNGIAENDVRVLLLKACGQFDVVDGCQIYKCADGIHACLLRDIFCTGVWSENVPLRHKGPEIMENNDFSDRFRTKIKKRILYLIKYSGLASKDEEGRATISSKIVKDYFDLSKGPGADDFKKEFVIHEANQFKNKEELIPAGMACFTPTIEHLEDKNEVIKYSAVETGLSPC